jgi:DNA-binding MarR family transcriptional regulator
MTEGVVKRQHAVDAANERSPAGEALNALLVQVIELTRHFTVAGERLAEPVGQTLARWLVLAECKDAPATVAEIARRLRLARQSVQRVADVLAGQGLCSYKDNPRHRRAKLLALTPKGRKTLARIEDAQREWSNALGERIGEGTLRAAGLALAPVLEAVERGERGERR